MEKQKKKKRNKKKIFSKNFFKIKNNFYLLELKGTYNNFFINFFEYNYKVKKKQIYYLSSGIVFQNSQKSDKYSSIKLAELVAAYIFENEIKNIIVRIFNVNRKIKKFIKSLKNFPKLQFVYFLFFIEKINFIFNGVKDKDKKV